jgi:FemAB-related protein (PEP-CTERM system-associated)
MQDKDREAWDDFVCHADHSTFFHLSGWKNVLENALGLQTYFLFARERSRVLGVLPLIQVRSRLSGNYFTSLPGALCSQDETVAQGLVAHAKDLVCSEGAGYLILRDSYRKWDLPGLVTNSDHCTMLVQLSKDPKTILSKADHAVRKGVKKAQRIGLEIWTGMELMDIYYPVYSAAMRSKGTPTLGIKFFRSMAENFPEIFETVVVTYNGKILGGGFIAFFKDTVYNTWGGMLRKYYHLRSNYLLYWIILKNACEQGYRWLDMGRSTINSGNYEFKKQWVGQPQTLYQQFILNGRKALPAVGGRWEDDLKYRTFTGLWKHLPIPLVETLGPYLRKSMPFG